MSTWTKNRNLFAKENRYNGLNHDWLVACAVRDHERTLIGYDPVANQFYPIGQLPGLVRGAI